MSWLPDIKAWARAVAACVALGGAFYLIECHPMLWTLDDECADPAFVVKYPYFETVEPGFVASDAQTYADGPLLTAAPVSYEWTHGLGETIDALLQAGLYLEFVHEHREVPWPALPWMVQGDDPRTWVLPEHGDLIPLMYSLRAPRPV